MLQTGVNRELVCMRFLPWVIQIYTWITLVFYSSKW
jgi:hypothetical protein